MADAAGDPVVGLKHNSLRGIAMKRSTLELLCCPSCQTELALHDELGNTSRNGAIKGTSHISLDVNEEAI
jgi:hypothetical protein